MSNRPFRAKASTVVVVVVVVVVRNKGRMVIY